MQILRFKVGKNRGRFIGVISGGGGNVKGYEYLHVGSIIRSQKLKLLEVIINFRSDLAKKGNIDFG